MERGDAEHSHVLNMAIKSEQLPHIEIKIEMKYNWHVYAV